MLTKEDIKKLSNLLLLLKPVVIFNQQMALNQSNTTVKSLAFGREFQSARQQPYTVAQQINLYCIRHNFTAYYIV